MKSVNEVVAILESGAEVEFLANSKAIENVLATGYAGEIASIEVAITFTSGATYGYLIPMDLFLEFYVAESKGRFYHNKIRGKYNSIKL